MGVIGFCLRGGFALLAASRFPFQAASANYGEVPENPERVLAGACPIIATYGGRDRTMRGRAARLGSALTAAGVEHRVKTYPDAGHSFLRASGYPPSFQIASWALGMHAGPHAPSADDAWRQIAAFFGKHLTPDVQ